MSKLSFRARALDASKPMPVYYKHELSDLQDYSVLNRAVPQMPSGMEKEEETEHHLQRAISAQQVYGDTKVMVIPVPEAEISLDCYNNLYKKTFRLPKHYVHNQAQALNSIMEQEQPDYDMDSEDEKWMKETKKRAGLEVTNLQFEEMIDRLEKSCGNQLVTLQEAKLLLKEDDDLIKAVYEYWLKKRKRQKAPLLFQVRQDRRDGSSINDCYVAFRRRTEKMQTRKNRKNDEASYEKMLKLRRDLSRAVTILEMVKRREKSKCELLHLTLEVFEKRYQMRDWEGKTLRSVKKDLLAQKSWAHFRSLKSYRRRHPSLSSTLVAGHKLPPAASGPSISRGEIDREPVVHPKKKFKKKHARPSAVVGNGAVQAAPSGLNSQQNVEVVERPKLPAKGAATTRSPASATTKWSTTTANSDVLSYEAVVDTMTQYEFPPSSDEEIKEQIGTTSPIETFDIKKYPDGAFTFRRRPGCVYYAPQENLVGDWPWMSDHRHRYNLTTLSIPEKCVGFARRRMGRGGRLLLDRGHHPYSREVEKLDLGLEHRHQSAKPHLQELLQEIKKNRWRHYRPSQHDQVKSAPPDDESTSDADSVFPWNSPYYPTDFFRDPSETKSSTSNLRDSAAEQTQKISRLSSVKSSHKRASLSHTTELDKSSVAFAMSALVSVPTTTPVATATTTQGHAGASRLTFSHRPGVTKPFKQVNTQQTKCVTCGGIVTLTTSVTNARADTGSTDPNSNRPLTLPVTLSVATPSITSSIQQRTTVLPATVTVSTSKAGGGMHTAGVPALLKISSSGSVVGGTVIYPQQQGVKTEDGKTAPEAIADARRTVVGPRSQRSAVNLSFALPATVLASIKNEAQSGSRATQSAPSSPRTAVMQMLPSEGGNGMQSKKASQGKTISLNLGSFVSSAQPLITSSSNQTLNTGRITIGGNVLKLGNSIFPVTFNPSSKSSPTVVAAPSVNVATAADLGVDKGPKKATPADGDPVNHTVQIDIGTPPTGDPSAPNVIEQIAGSVTPNTVQVKSSKSSRPMEVT